MWDLILEVLTGDLLPVVEPVSDIDTELLNDYPELLTLGISI